MSVGFFLLIGHGPNLRLSFFLVGLLFVLFDLEVVFVLPWAWGVSEYGLGQFLLLVIFLSFLVLGFIYEVARGALDFS